MAMAATEYPGDQLAVLPREILRQEIWKFPIDAAALVAEVTSPGNAQTDRVAKLRGYARSHVPAYLLIDRDSDTVTLFGGHMAVSV